MKKYFYYLVFAIILFANPLIIKAECTYSEKVRLQKIAGNINFSYDFEEKFDNEKVTGVEFFIMIANIHPDIYIKDTLKNEYYYYDDKYSIIKNGDYISGITNIFYIYSNIDNCKDQLIYTKYVNLPFYNRYYNDEVCRGIESYELCQRWQTTNLTYSQFIKKVNKYKESLIEKPNPNTPNKNDEFNFEYIYRFISKYYFIILVTIIIICLSAIFYLNKKNSFDLK